MLSDVFYWLLSMTLSATIMGTIVLLLGRIRRFPRNILCILWLIPLVRMWVPMGVSSKYSLMALIRRFTTVSVPVYTGKVQMTMTNIVMWADGYFPISYKYWQLQRIIQIASIVWLTVAAGLLILLAVMYMIANRQFRSAKHLKDNVYTSDEVRSALVCGVINSRIVIPSSYTQTDIKYVLLHENAHIRRKDNLWRFVALCTACVHWFNPATWLFLKSFFTQMELACDEAVVKSCSAEERREYATALLNSANNRNLLSSAFGGANLKIRLVQILSYKKLSILAMTASVLLAVFLGYVLLTNAK